MPKASPVPQFPKASPIVEIPKVTQTAIETSLTTGLFIDCQFSLYSRRLTSNGTVHTPRAVYANSEVLKQTAEHFQSRKYIASLLYEPWRLTQTLVISGGFSEGMGGSMGSAKKMPIQITAEEYGYESDSDLEDDYSSTPSFIGPSASTEALPTSNGDPQPSSEANAMLPDEGALPSGGSSQSESSVAEDSVHPEVPVHHHVIVIPDIAFKTFKALVYYAYTGQIHFAKLRSAREQTKDSFEWPPPSSLACSPKSMYRLADKYGLTTLKDLAVKNIRSQLSRQNAMQETLSCALRPITLPRRYTEVINLETAYICESKTRVDCLWDLELWTQRVVNGELPHAGEAFATLIRKLANRP
ncbi:hypothetical protein C2E23DRAFT_774272 [Lenzites betulinus]|nr:hypothetical protein C2E23DRAFT_774272 [Lenzites betulinus]